jgi:hypothetical protein
MKNVTSTSATMDQLTNLLSGMIVDSLKNTSALLQAAMGLLSPAPAAAKSPCACGCSSPGDCTCGCGCKIPETACPPRCVCTMKLAAMTGQSVIAGIRVVNQAHETRTFALAATPFYSGVSQAEFTFAPASLTLAPGKSGFAAGTLTIPTAFAKGTYEAEITVTGAYEQCVKVGLEVGCDDHCSATCEVVECERYERIRAHHWYDHFQCVEDCGPPRLRPREAGVSPGTGP